MRICKAHLIGMSPYGMSRYHTTPKLSKENNDAYEDRTWIERSHYTRDTQQIFIPPMAFKFSLDAAAKQRGDQIAGKGKATYTKYFINGVMVINGPLVFTRNNGNLVPVFKSDVRKHPIHANADGVRGSGKRVIRFIPTVDTWECDVEFMVLNDQITKEVFEATLNESGAFVGVGQFRAQVGGTNGRFVVERITWSEQKSVNKESDESIKS